MANKEKTLEQYRKGFKRRGIIYIVIIILTIIASIVLSITPVENALFLSLVPNKTTINYEGSERTMYNKIVEQDGDFYILHYIDDKDGQKRQISSGFHKNTDGTSVYISNGDEIAKAILSAIKKAVVAVMALFIIIFVIYLLRLSYYLSNEDEEWRNKASDKLLSIRMKLDKISTSFSEKAKKKGKKN